MLKASMGGGGKGMRLIHSAEEVEEAYTTAKSESLSSFGDDTVYLEKFVEEPHHIEFQILGDKHGNVIHLRTRMFRATPQSEDCGRKSFSFRHSGTAERYGRKSGGCRQSRQLYRCGNDRVSW